MCLMDCSGPNLRPVFFARAFHPLELRDSVLSDNSIALQYQIAKSEVFENFDSPLQSIT